MRGWSWALWYGQVLVYGRQPLFRASSVWGRKLPLDPEPFLQRDQIHHCDANSAMQ